SGVGDVVLAVRLAGERAPAERSGLARPRRAELERAALEPVWGGDHRVSLLGPLGPVRTVRVPVGRPVAARSPPSTGSRPAAPRGSGRPPRRRPAPPPGRRPRRPGPR